MEQERGSVFGRIGRPGLGPYQLLEPLGAGRDTLVWQAESLQTGQAVAVKLYPQWYGEDRAYVQRFLRYTQNRRQISHPHLLPLLDAGEDDGWTYLVSPLVAGGSLEDRLDGRPWTLAEAIKLLEPLAAVLDALHAEGRVHGNLKPSNVLLDNREDEPWPLLTDPHVVRPAEASTEPGQFDLLLGSPTYASPEQSSGTSLDTGPASDRYSLGVLAYQLITGRPPFVGVTALSVLLDHIVRLPPSACALNPRLPADCERTLAVMLAKDPDRRFASGSAFVAALRAAASSTVTPISLRARTGPGAAPAPHKQRGENGTVTSFDRPAGAVATAGGLGRWQCRVAWSAP